MGRHKGTKHSVDVREKMRIAHTGIKNHFYGKIHTSETREKISIANKGIIPWNKGLKLSEEHRKKLSLAKRKYFDTGKHPHNWIENRTERMDNHNLRCCHKWAIWRGEVFERDKYTCRECGVSGVYLEPHHINPIRLDKKNIYNKNNGITLCRPCHQKTVWKELSFFERYSQLVVAQN